jgi:(p)ppGpp synthase/HD superfamily hydrolase
MNGMPSRFSAAVAMAEQVHAGVNRKGTAIPYLAHAIGVSALVLEFGGSEDEAIAGLLHDTIEDGGDPTSIRARILDEFGPAVLEIVEAMTDAAPERGEAKPPWQERKEAYIAHLRHVRDARVHRVCLADKLYNLRSINEDLQEIGDALWDRFSAPPDAQFWYFSSLGQVFAAGPLAGSRAQRAFDLEVRRLERHLIGRPRA